MAKPRIVILGAGFAGAYCAQRLERLVRNDTEVVLIDRHNFFVFTPLLIEAGIGTVEPRHAVVPVRDFLTHTEFHMAWVKGLDTDRRRVQIQHIGSDAEEEIAYDHVVLALGSVTRWLDIPGLRENAFEMKHLQDAIALRDRAVELLELAASTQDESQRRELLHWVVVGANFSGAEVAGEYLAYLQRGCDRYPGLDRDLVRVTLIEIQDRILSALDPALSEKGAASMRKRGVDIRLEESVTEIGEDFARLKSGETLKTRTVIWTAGVQPSPVLGQLGLPLDKRGSVICETDFCVRGLENVWGIGDCASNPDPDGNPYPPTAQHAVRMADVLADNLAAAVKGKPTRPCTIHGLGSLAALGDRTGVAKVLGLKLAGFPAWFLWRTVYLFKMPGVGRKIRVGIDWALEFLFSKDYVQIGTVRRHTKNHHKPSDQ